MKVRVYLAEHEAARLVNLLDMVARSDDGVDGISAANLRNQVEYAIARQSKKPKRGGRSK